MKSNLQHLGALLGHEAKADNYLPRMSGHSTNKRLGLQGPARKGARVLLLIGNAGGKPLVAGKDTAAGGWCSRPAGITGNS